MNPETRKKVASAIATTISTITGLIIFGVLACSIGCLLLVLVKLLITAYGGVAVSSFLLATASVSCTFTAILLIVRNWARGVAWNARIK